MRENSIKSFYTSYYSSTTGNPQAQHQCWPQRHRKRKQVLIEKTLFYTTLDHQEVIKEPNKLFDPCSNQDAYVIH